jgi:hypothetical protein
VYGYPASVAMAGIVQLLVVPFVLASRRQASPADEANAPVKPTSEETGR